MRVIVYTNVLAFEQPGGAEIYLKNLIKELKRQGNEEGIIFDFYDINNSLGNYDIAVFYNSTTYSILAYEFLATAKRYSLRTVNIPVYFSLRSLFKGFERIIFLLGLFFIRSYVSRFGPLFRSKLEYLYLSLKLADIVMVSGRGEMETLNRDFGISMNNMYILPIAVESRFASSKPDLFIEEYGISDFILYVGRIERRKNVLKLIKAFEIAQIDIPLVIIGYVKEEDYYKEIQSYITRHNLSRKIMIIPGLKHYDPLLASAYAASKVFVLPSYYETPGIAALEAALAGANIVITRYGTTKEYFKDYALYVDPFNVNDIARKLRIAVDMPRPNEALRRHILNNFTYEAVAKRFLEIVQWLL